MQDTSIRYWIWLSLLCGAASPYANLLCNLFENDAERIYRLDGNELASHTELPASLLKKLQNKDLSEADAILKWCRQNDVFFLHPGQARYPDKLRSIERMPLLLYCKGRLPDFDEEVCIGMVGTRKMTEYGRRTSYLLAYDLAKCGAYVISGMASGIDSMAHRGALDCNGKTVAVLGCGIDRIYPASNKEIYRDLIRFGGIVTEYKPFTPPNGPNFPLRNRIISALSQGTVVMEAAYRSGALITARYALYQGRDLFAFPGKVGEMNSDGVHQLLKNGAKLVTDAADVLEEYECLYPDKIRTDRIPHYLPDPDKLPHSGSVLPQQKEKRAPKVQKPKVDGKPDFSQKAAQSIPAIFRDEDPPPPKRAEADLSSLCDLERIVYDAMEGTTPYDADTLCRKTQLSSSDVATALTLLEIKQIIQALPGGLYRRL
jgi:DNA processing protein